MSSRVQINIFLIAVANLSDQSKMKEVFISCCDELGLNIKSDHLVIDGNAIGKLNIGKTITLQYTGGLTQGNLSKLNDLRELYTNKISIISENLTYQNKQAALKLQQQKEILSKYDFEMNEKKIKEEQKKLENQKKALERQKKEHNEALREEICGQALNLGYEVNYDQLPDGSVNIQLVKYNY